MLGNKRENEMQRSAGTILCCLATASDKNTTISTKYDKLTFLTEFELELELELNLDFVILARVVSKQRR